MLLNNLTLANTNQVIDIQIAGKTITKVSKSGTINEPGLSKLRFENAVVFPGLINSHDHLDFNLYPRLGNRIYNNYTEWASTIHKDHRQEIAEVKGVPEELRIEWGIYKNLICGVTTVVNHGNELKQRSFLISVIQSCECLHSVAFERRLKWKLNNLCKADQPIAIHAGEGTDAFASGEIDYLIKWNLLRRKLVGIHGVAMNEEQAKKFKALVWCPGSNFFMLDRTADIERIKDNTTVCFGSDSTLTSDWNIWEHLRLAKEKTRCSDTALLDMLTVNPAAVWKLNKGFIEQGREADIVVANKTANGFSAINPGNILLVICQGEVCLFDQSICEQLQNNGFDYKPFSAISIDGSIKCVKGNIKALMANIQQYNRAIKFPVEAIQEPVLV